MSALAPTDKMTVGGETVLPGLLVGNVTTLQLQSAAGAEACAGVCSLHVHALVPDLAVQVVLLCSLCCSKCRLQGGWTAPQCMSGTDA